MDNYYVNLDEVYKLKKSFILGDNIFNNNNKNYYNIKYDNKFLYINFKANIYNLELIPRKKLFLQVDVDIINNFKKLIKLISRNIKVNIQEYDIPRNFHGIITLKIKSLCKDTYNNEINYKLVNDIHKITIINEIHEKEDEDNESENNNLILKLINS